MVRIILDTNFIVSAARFKIDLFAELRRVCDFKYSLYVLDGTYDELNRLSQKGSGKDKQAVRVARMLLRKGGVSLIKTDKDKIVDDLILDMVSKEPKRYAVATQDLALKRRLGQLGVRRIVIRQRRVLALI